MPVLMVVCSVILKPAGKGIFFAMLWQGTQQEAANATNFVSFI